MQCDFCHIEFSKKYVCTLVERSTHYCSSFCNNRNEQKKLRIQQECMRRFGVPHASQSDVCKDKAKQTLQRKYGVNSPFELEHVKLSKNTPIAVAKQLETKRTRGCHISSKVERKFLAELSLVTEVEVHPRVGGRASDAYIIAYDTYVQLDGIFWHGLDRSEFGLGRLDTNISKKFEGDRGQDHLFVEEAKRLVRLTDFWYKSTPDAIERVMGLLRSSWTGVRYLGEHYATRGVSV